ncbi:MAG: hypothetical protein KJO72_06425 [Gammaproteobacteria bacterium]|nr:hypothetical protein [Gammaproteobacteria bacterium]
MKEPIFQLWNSLQPVLSKPRWWVASLMRRMLLKTTFIAITGSNGKTTATRYLAAILSAHAPTQWTRLSRNGPAGITETIAFCNPWKTRYAVFEVGYGTPGSVAQAASLVRPDIAVVLSVFLEHRAAAKNLETVAREKAELLKSLSGKGVAVLNSDDHRVAGMHVPAGCRTIRYGSGEENEVRFENAVSAWPQLLRFTAVVGGQRLEIRTRLLGTHWVGCILSCIAVAHELGLPLDEVAKAIEKVSPYPARMQVVQLPGGAVVIRDEMKGSAHTIEAAFAEVRKATAQRKFLLFCDESETSRSPRVRLARIGRQAAELFDQVVFIGERAHHGVSGAVKAGLSERQARAFADYTGASDFLQPLLGPGDLVLLKGTRNNQLTRVFYSLLEEVRCTVSQCKRTMVCDDCRDFRNPELVRRVNEQLTVRIT